jgi:hypothetical protein
MTMPSGYACVLFLLLDCVDCSICLSAIFLRHAVLLYINRRRYCARFRVVTTVVDFLKGNSLLRCVCIIVLTMNGQLWIFFM